MKRRGLFVTLEGIEGSGKSSQASILAAELRRRGHRVILTREPGGTRAGEAVRRLFLGPAGRGLDPWAELFLVESARAQHLAEVIRPALAAGRVVICDRFTDSTLAYQGYGRGLPRRVIRALHRLAGLRPEPDLTLLFDLPVDEGLARASGRNSASAGKRRESRIDTEAAAFHERVRRGYRLIARREPSRVELIPGSADRRSIGGIVLSRVTRRLAPLRG